MKKIVRLTESDLVRLVNRVIKEQGVTTSIPALNVGTGESLLKKLNSTPNKTSAASGQNTNLTGNDRIANLAGIMSSVQRKQVPQMVIVSDNPKLNNMPWDDYIRGYKITKTEILQAKELLNKFGKKTIVE
jgi:hypothetical protein